MVIFSLVFYMPVQFQTFNIPCLKKILVIIVHKAVLRKACGQYYISYNYLVKFNDLLRFHTHKILFMQEITGHINSTCSKEIRIENIFANVKSWTFNESEIFYFINIYSQIYLIHKWKLIKYSSVRRIQRFLFSFLTAYLLIYNRFNIIHICKPFRWFHVETHPSFSRSIKISLRIFS